MQVKMIGETLHSLDFNVIRVMFLFVTLVTGFLGLLLNCIEPHLPVLITRTYRYGKYAVNKHSPIVSKAEVPKRWYKHFYIFAAPSASYIFYITLHKYFFNGQVPEQVEQMLDALLGTSRQALVSPASTIIAVTLLTMQCWKRLYETQCVNIFSDAMMNISHYIIGFIHYVGALICLIGESEGFVKDHEAVFSWKNVTFLHLICIVIFVWSCYTQLNANFILRRLRQNEDGEFVRTGYKIPRGALFEYISGALQFTEILMYVTVSIILWKSTTFHYVTAWVIVNQVECAVLTHQWYKKTFKNYPKSRKAIIPYLF